MPLLAYVYILHFAMQGYKPRTVATFPQTEVAIEAE